MTKCFMKLVTFDATNTLIKFRVPPWIHYKNVAENYGFVTDDYQIKQRLKQSFKDMHKAHPNFGKNSIQWQEWWKMIVRRTFDGLLPATAIIDSIAIQLIDDFRTAKCWEVSEGSLELINALQSNGVCIGVLSNFDPRLKDVLQNLKLLEYFKFVLTSYDAGFSKPDKRIFEFALQKSNLTVAPYECVHIGDDIKADYCGAVAAGWRSLIVTNSVIETPPAPHHVFKNLNQLCIALQSNQITL